MNSLFTTDDKIKVLKSPFSAYENEGVKYDGQSRNVRLEEIISRVQKKQITDIDYLILEAISELEFATSRMITQYMILRNIEEITQRKIYNRLKFLNKCKVICRYYFLNDKTETNLRIYCLEKHGRTLLIGRNYPCKWKQTDSIKSIGEMKSILARNQVLMAFREKVTNLYSYEVNPTIKQIKSGIMFNSHLLITLNSEMSEEKDELLFESIRSYAGYREHLVYTLKKYQEYYKHLNLNFTKTKPAKFIIIGEDDNHLFEIFKIILKEQIVFKNTDIIFTHDLRILNDEVNKRFISFQLDINQDKPKVRLIELNISQIIY